MATHLQQLDAWISKTRPELVRRVVPIRLCTETVHGIRWVRPDEIETERRKHATEHGFLQKARLGLVPKRVPIHSPSGKIAYGIRWVRPEHGQRVTPSGIRIPPAWTNVWINADPNGALQVVGYDAKGRRQYIYSREHSEKAAAEKFKRLKDFDKALPKIRAHVQRDAIKNDAAAVLYLIDKTGIRVGSPRETLAAKRAYGATTIEGRHVTIDGDQVTLDFDAKKGTHVTKVIKDPFLAKILSARKKRDNKPIFNTSERDVLQYLRDISGKRFLPKDFRTWFGTKIALQEIAKMPVPTRKREYQRARLVVAKVVSEFLGNTPAMALSAYIAPEVFSHWQAALEQQFEGEKS